MTQPAAGGFGPKDDGKLDLFSGVGVIVRGDLLLCMHTADASAERNVWLMRRGEELAAPYACWYPRKRS